MQCDLTPRIDKDWRKKVTLGIKDFDNADYYYNFLATTTIVFNLSTTLVPSFIA
ncbi:MAG: hypothetical protein O6940_09580 [Ignavibacteria bacterium]|nr:hypothetical protein [Ignavibacteria bacterium]